MPQLPCKGGGLASDIRIEVTYRRICCEGVHVPGSLCLPQHASDLLAAKSVSS